jgi:hypothetical protein
MKTDAHKAYDNVTLTVTLEIDPAHQHDFDVAIKGHHTPDDSILAQVFTAYKNSRQDGYEKQDP